MGQIIKNNLYIDNCGIFEYYFNFSVVVYALNGYKLSLNLFDFSPDCVFLAKHKIDFLIIDFTGLSIRITYNGYNFYYDHINVNSQIFVNYFLFLILICNLCIYNFRVELCAYSGLKIYPGHGRRVVRNDGRVY